MGNSRGGPIHRLVDYRGRVNVQVVAPVLAGEGCKLPPVNDLFG